MRMCSCPVCKEKERKQKEEEAKKQKPEDPPIERDTTGW